MLYGVSTRCLSLSTQATLWRHGTRAFGVCVALDPYLLPPTHSNKSTEEGLQDSIGQSESGST